MSDKYTGHVHNAKRVTFDGRDCFIAAIHVDGKYRVIDPPGGDNVSEHTTQEEAIDWLYKRLTALGVETPIMAFEDGPPCEIRRWPDPREQKNKRVLLEHNVEGQIRAIRHLAETRHGPDAVLKLKAIEKACDDLLNVLQENR